MKVIGIKFVFVISFLFMFFSCSSKREDKIIRVVFYKVPTDVAKSIEGELKKALFSNDEEIELEVEEINEANKLSERVKKKGDVSLVFSNTTRLPFEMGEMTPFDVSLYETFPSCIKRYSFENLEKDAEGATSLPILINTYHLFSSNRVFESDDETNFYDVNAFSNMLKEISSSTKYPLLCAGGEDETLLFFVASVMQMVGDVYSEENKKIKNLKDRGHVLDATLKLIVDWQKNGFLHPEWFRLKDRDISMFMDLKEVGILFTRMSEYRKSEAKQFYSLMPYMPLSKDVHLNGLPISVLSITKLIQKGENTSATKNEYISKMIEYCISVEGQAGLSKETGFTSSSMSNMSQSSSSSLRYLLATVSVVLKDVGSILLEDSVEKSLLAKEMREYFQVNGVGY